MISRGPEAIDPLSQADCFRVQVLHFSAFFLCQFGEKLSLNISDIESLGHI